MEKVFNCAKRLEVIPGKDAQETHDRQKPDTDQSEPGQPAGKATPVPTVAFSPTVALPFPRRKPTGDYSAVSLNQ